MNIGCRLIVRLIFRHRSYGSVKKSLNRCSLCRSLLMKAVTSKLQLSSLLDPKAFASEIKAELSVVHDYT